MRGERSSEAILQAAEALCGTPFRLHGRNPETGLDCVGLVARALDGAGVHLEPPNGYRLRQLYIEPLFAHAASCGLVEAIGPTRPGDVVLMRPGPAQFHLGIAGAAGSLVHAHAGLGRVVRMPIPGEWPVTRSWRVQQD